VSELKNNKSELILKGNIYKVLITLSIPIMLNSIIQTLYNLVDGIWVSKISSVHFAATSFVWPINFLFIAIGIGISIAGTSILSRLVGAEKYEEAKEYSNQLIVTSFLISIIFALIGFLISPYIIKVIGGEGDILEYGNIYLRVTFLDMPFMFLYFSLYSIMTAQGDTITPTTLSGISAIINVVLDPIFIFNLNLGIAGAAWATLVSKMILAMIGLYYLFKGSSNIKPNLNGFSFDREIIKEIYTVAIPASIGQIGASVGFMALNGFIVSYGTATMAAFGMVNRITNLVMQPAMSVGSALTAVIGQNLGASQEDRARDSFIKASTIALTIGTIGGIVIYVFNNQIINFFILSKDDPLVITESITYMRYVAFSMPLMGMFSVFQGIFQGSGNTKYSMAMEVGRLWFVRLPMILLFKHLTDFGSTGIWFSMSFSNLIVCLYGYIMYKVKGIENRANKSSERLNNI
jgi:putative MATE family efflux protein